MNNLLIYSFISIILIVLSLLILYIYRKQIPFLEEDKIETTYDAKNALDEANKTVENINRLVDNKRAIKEEMKEIYKRSSEPP